MYAKIINEQTKQCDVGLTDNIEFFKSIGMTQMDVKQSDIDNQWYLSEYCPMKTEEEKQTEEKQRIAMLKLTRGDVFRGLLQAKGITRAVLREQIEAMPENTTEEIISKEMALIDFDEALDFYRGNTLIDTIGIKLGITAEQLDKFFEDGNYEHLLSVEETNTEVDAESENTTESDDNLITGETVVEE